ncbi:hypothetical protein C0Q70_16639 [Pomacea canaliculata]|uniref:Uncharacterized protein n=1 Tax=Pomacea canaliculata TaxID=400727 RepID=A0A2T7NQC5_POMCA|nr:hypothetical protein C0Q70_16639 [Pomacea canaliculata]
MCPENWEQSLVPYTPDLLPPRHKAPPTIVHLTLSRSTYQARCCVRWPQCGGVGGGGGGGVDGVGGGGVGGGDGGGGWGRVGGTPHSLHVLYIATCCTARDLLYASPPRAAQRLPHDVFSLQTVSRKTFR